MTTKTTAELAKKGLLNYCRKLFDLFATRHGRQPRTMAEMETGLEAEMQAGRLPAAHRPRT